MFHLASSRKKRKYMMQERFRTEFKIRNSKLAKGITPIQVKGFSGAD